MYKMTQLFNLKRFRMRPCSASYAMQRLWGWAFLDWGLLSTLPHGALIPVKAGALGVYPAQKGRQRNRFHIAGLHVEVIPCPVPMWSASPPQ